MVDRYLLSGHAGGLAPATTRWYDLLLRAYVNWDGAPRTVAAFDASSVVAFLAWLRDRVGPRGRRVSAETLHAHYRVLRAFASWLAREGHTKRNVLADLRPPRRQRNSSRRSRTTMSGASSASAPAARSMASAIA